jgi:hypothetical protein
VRAGEGGCGEMVLRVGEEDSRREMGCRWVARRQAVQLCPSADPWGALSAMPQSSCALQEGQRHSAAGETPGECIRCPRDGMAYSEALHLPSAPASRTGPSPRWPPGPREVQLAPPLRVAAESTLEEQPKPLSRLGRRNN